MTPMRYMLGTELLSHFVKDSDNIVDKAAEQGKSNDKLTSESSEAYYYRSSLNVNRSS
jgi:hypothetical protein